MPTKKTKKIASTKKSATANSKDIIQIILHDHKPLKKLIKTLKNSDKDLSTRQAAFEDFSILLTIHAKAEEKTLYVFMKNEIDQREEAYEGDVEHGLADQMVEEVKRTDDEELWSARVKVLAELVEHHIKEEEEEMFPDFKKQSTLEQRIKLGEKYLQKKPEVLSDEVKSNNIDESVDADLNKQMHLS